MAQLVQHLPRTQKIAGSSPARGSSSFSLEKKELSSGVVACICLVSITDYSCICMYMYISMYQYLIHEFTCLPTHTLPPPPPPPPRRQGGQLWCLALDSLLDYRDYQQWLLDTRASSCSSLPPAASEEEFQERSRQAWTYLLLQVIKVSAQ